MFSHATKFYWLTFEKTPKGLAGLGNCQVTYSRPGVDENLLFSRVLKHISECFPIFFHVLAADISLLVGPLATLETREFFKQSVLAQARLKTMIFLTKI